MTTPTNYDGRRFRALSNSTEGDVDDTTIFDYRQEGYLVWASYSGGAVAVGTLIAQVDESDNLDMHYQHLDIHGDFKSGVCRSTPEWLPDGRLRLHERWRWTSGAEGDGESVVEEIK